MGKTIKLSKAERYTGANLGVYRRLKNYKLQEKFPDYSKNAWTRDIEAACAEIAVAKALGIYFHWGESEYGGGDIHYNGHELQVRLNMTENRPLWVYDKDNDDHILVAVSGYMGQYDILGFLPIAECKRPEWFKTPPDVQRACYRPPLEKLIPFEELKELENEGM